MSTCMLHISIYSICEYLKHKHLVMKCNGHCQLTLMQWLFSLSFPINVHVPTTS